MKKSKTLIAGSLVSVVLVTLIIAVSWMAMANSENQTGDKTVKPVSKFQSMQSTVIGTNNNVKSYDTDIETNDDRIQDTENHDLEEKNDQNDLNETDTKDIQDPNDIEDLGDD